MKTLWIFTALVLAALFNESHQIQNILVVTGTTEDGTRHPISGNKYKIVSQKVEIWSQQKTQCVVPDFPVAVSSAVGFWTAQGPTVCGGSSYTIYHLEESPCYFFNNKQHQWMPWTPLKKKRESASAIVTQIDRNEALIIGGGLVGSFAPNRVNSTETLSPSGSIEGEFPVAINGHCTFKVNSTHGLITGGRQDGSDSTSTWYVDLTTLTFTPGPEMLMRRWHHGCATFQMGDKTYGIVSGGSRDVTKEDGIPRSYSVQLDSTEILDLDQRSPIWTEGPKLPSKLYGHTMVETNEGTFVMGGATLIRGVDGSRVFDNMWSKVLQLQCRGNQIRNCQWRKMREGLELPRESHVSIPLPESYDICN